jgi:hypothetical protein
LRATSVTLGLIFVAGTLAATAPAALADSAPSPTAPASAPAPALALEPTVAPTPGPIPTTRAPSPRAGVREVPVGAAETGLADPAGLPTTGLPLALGGAALVGLAAGGVLVTRRRRTAAQG